MAENGLTSERLRAIAGLPAKRRLDALLDFEDAQAAVQSVSPEDLYLAISEVGLEDAAEIVQLSSPEQFRTYVDLGGWKKDRLLPEQLLTWLRAARGDAPEEFLAKLQKLDLEVLEALLRRKVVVHDLEENPDVNPEGVTYEMPEGRYLLEFPESEGVELQALRQLVADLVAADPFQAGRLLEAIRWEVPSELEETAYQFRAARLQDLGFPELYDALALFAFVDPAPYGKRVAPTGQGPLVASAHPQSYLEACFARVRPEEQEGLGEQLRYLINSALVAEGAEPGDPDAIRKVSEGARDLLALGLEHVTAGDPEAAADAVREHGFRRVFQIGFSLTLKLKFRADRLAKAPGYALEGVPLVFPDELRILGALRQRRPLRALKVEGADPVPFRSRWELEEIGAGVARAEQQVALLGALIPSGEALKAFAQPFEELTVPRLWRAIVSRAALGWPPWVGPISPERHRALVERLAQPVDSVIEQLSAVVPSEARPELSRLIQTTWAQLEEELILRDGRLPEALETLLPYR